LGRVWHRLTLHRKRNRFAGCDILFELHCDLVSAFIDGWCFDLRRPLLTAAHDSRTPPLHVTPKTKPFQILSAQSFWRSLPLRCLKSLNCQHARPSQSLSLNANQENSHEITSQSDLPAPPFPILLRSGSDPKNKSNKAVGHSENRGRSAPKGIP